MTLILSNADVEKLLPMHECIDALDEAYVELAHGRGAARTTSECFAPTERSDALYALKTMDGVIPKFGISALRLNSDIITWPKEGNVVRTVKVPAAPNNRYVGLVLLFSTHTGEPLAIMPDGVMQRMRVGAASALGIKFLARKEPAVVGLLGSGWQAAGQLFGVTAVRDVTAVRCFSPNREHRMAFAQEMTATLGREVTAVEQPEDAVAGADIVLCASNSLDAIFFDRWIEPGMHLSSIKNPEIEVAAIRRANRVVVHSRDTTSLFFSTAGLLSPKEAKNKVGTGEAKIDFAPLPTLAELCAGMTPPRQSANEVTCFLNNIGLGYQFAAAGAVVYRKAKEAGIGHELPTEWFTEDVHP
jgi:alanine dehydrogenase